MLENVPVVPFYPLGRVNCVEWVTRRSAGDLAKLIGQNQSTNGRTGTEDDSSIDEGENSFLDP